MSAVEWADPPNLPPARNRTEEAIKELKLHPGTWAVVATGQTSSSDAEKWQRHGAETTTRRERSGWITVYARWPKEAQK